MRMVRWMCGIKGVPSKQLGERLTFDDIISVLHQNKLQWYKKENDWVNKCMEYEVEKDCQT